MKADEFLKIVRKGSDKLRVDNLVLQTAEQEHHGKGMLKISKEEIEIDFIFDTDERPPALRYGVFTSKDKWKLCGLIEDQLQFKCEIAPGGSAVFGERAIITFHIHPIELIPTGWDAMSREERVRIRQELFEKQQIITPNSQQEQPNNDDEKQSEMSVYFHALLLNYPIPTLACEGTQIIEKNPYLGERPSGQLDTVKGEIGNFKFAFIKERDEGDLHVHLESKKGYNSPSEQEDWRMFNALMQALAFAEGVHAWPYRIEYWRRGQKITHKITATRELASTVYTPFHLMNSHFRDVIKKAAEFFEKDTVLSKEVARILFLFREAGNKNDITTLTLCTLFESLVRLLFKHLNLKHEAEEKDETLKLFEKAKEEVCNEISKQVVEKGKGYERLYNYIYNAQLLSTKEMFQAVANHFGLQWENDMDQVFYTWKNLRNPLAHGHERSDQSEDERKKFLLDESRIAGVINLLVLKLFGFSGKMSASVFEDKYRQV
jgi:hypothetical protein